MGNPGLGDSSSVAAWLMEGFDRFGTGQAMDGPDPADFTTPWFFDRLSPTEVVSHGPAIGSDGIGYYGTWVGNDLVKFDTATGVILGSFDALNFVQCTPAIGNNGLVYITTVKNFSFDPPGRLFAIDPNTMDWVWTFQTDFRKVSDFQSCSPTIGPDGDIVVGSKIGKAWRLDGQTGAVEWEVTMRGAPYTIPFSRDDSKVFVSNDNILTAINYADGTIAWSFTAGAWFGAPGVAPDGTVVVGNVSGTVYGFDPDTGAINWTFGALGQVLAAPAFSSDGVAYVGSFDHRLYALRTSDGVRNWSFASSHEIWSMPGVGHDGRIYFGNRVGSLYSLAPNGSLIWQIQAAGTVRGPVTVGPDASIYMGPLGGGLAVIRQQATFPPVEEIAIIRGIGLAGGLPDLEQSDDERLLVGAGVTLFLGESPLQIDMTGTSRTETPVELRFKLEANVNTPGLTQDIQLYNYSTSTYDSVDFSVPGFADASVEIVITTNPENYVQTGTREMKAKVVYQQVGLTLLWPWSAGIDQGVWTIVPPLGP